MPVADTSAALEVIRRCLRDGEELLASCQAEYINPTPLPGSNVFWLALTPFRLIDVSRDGGNASSRLYRELTTFTVAKKLFGPSLLAWDEEEESNEFSLSRFKVPRQFAIVAQGLTRDFAQRPALPVENTTGTAIVKTADERFATFFPSGQYQEMRCDACGGLCGYEKPFDRCGACLRTVANVEGSTERH